MRKKEAQVHRRKKSEEEAEAKVLGTEGEAGLQEDGPDLRGGMRGEDEEVPRVTMTGGREEALLMTMIDGEDGRDLENTRKTEDDE